MAQDASPSIRQQVVATLSQIIHLSLVGVGRALDMRMFDFGTLRPVESGSAGHFALHVQCPWRIEGPGGIVTGRLDIWEPVEDNCPFDENFDPEESPNLQDARLKAWLAEHYGSLVVKAVDADEFGGASITFNHGFVLRLFPAGTRGEDWRFFQPRTGIRHFVIVGGRPNSMRGMT